MKNNNSEKSIYCGLGIYMILYFCPQFIPYAICISGLLVSTYGILKIINEHDSREKFDINKYME